MNLERLFSGKMIWLLNQRIRIDQEEAPAAPFDYPPPSFITQFRFQPVYSKTNKFAANSLRMLLFDSSSNVTRILQKTMTRDKSYFEELGDVIDRKYAYHAARWHCWIWYEKSTTTEAEYVALENIHSIPHRVLKRKTASWKLPKFNFSVGPTGKAVGQKRYVRYFLKHKRTTCL